MKRKPSKPRMMLLRNPFPTAQDLRQCQAMLDLWMAAERFAHGKVIGARRDLAYAQRIRARRSSKTRRKERA